jgi:predicted SAM-dependent methyltransferase
MKPENAVWLNLGCSDRKLPGFLNVDIRPESGADIIADVRYLNNVEDESVDLIYACHLFEHFDKHEYPTVLKTWFRKLKKGGILRLAVPNINAVCEHYIETRDLTQLYTSFWGSQRNPYDYHKWGWTGKTLTIAFKEAGFNIVQSWDWRCTYPHYLPECDDYAKAYLPHMDFENGRHISLNMEGIKQCIKTVDYKI